MKHEKPPPLMLLVAEVPVAAVFISWQVSSYSAKTRLLFLVHSHQFIIHQWDVGGGHESKQFNTVSWPVERFPIQDMDASRVTVSN